ARDEHIGKGVEKARERALARARDRRRRELLGVHFVRPACDRNRADGREIGLARHRSSAVSVIGGWYDWRYRLRVLSSGTLAFICTTMCRGSSVSHIWASPPSENNPWDLITG